MEPEGVAAVRAVAVHAIDGCVELGQASGGWSLPVEGPRAAEGIRVRDEVARGPGVHSGDESPTGDFSSESSPGRSGSRSPADGDRRALVDENRTRGRLHSDCHAAERVEMAPAAGVRRDPGEGEIRGRKDPSAPGHQVVVEEKRDGDRGKEKDGSDLHR